MSNYELYQEYAENREIQESMELMNENYVFLNGYPIIVIGDKTIIDFEDKDVYYKDNYMICGKGDKRKWREFRDLKKDGTYTDPYIITYNMLIETFGEDCAALVFDNGVIPDEW